MKTRVKTISPHIRKVLKSQTGSNALERLSIWIRVRPSLSAGCIKQHCKREKTNKSQHRRHGQKRERHKIRKIAGYPNVSVADNFGLSVTNELLSRFGILESNRIESMARRVGILVMRMANIASVTPEEIATILLGHLQ